MIPEFYWFAVRAAAFAGCLLWHTRSRSPHLVTTAAGLGIVILLMLPALHEEIFGWDTFEEIADHLLLLFTAAFTAAFAAGCLRSARRLPRKPA